MKNRGTAITASVALVKSQCELCHDPQDELLLQITPAMTKTRAVILQTRSGSTDVEWMEP